MCESISKLMCKHFFLKRYVFQHCVGSKWHQPVIKFEAPGIHDLHKHQKHENTFYFSMFQTFQKSKLKKNKNISVLCWVLLYYLYVMLRVTHSLTGLLSFAKQIRVSPMPQVSKKTGRRMSRRDNNLLSLDRFSSHKCMICRSPIRVPLFVHAPAKGC